MKNEDKKSATILLPERLVTTVDLARVFRELKMLDVWLTQANLREPGKPVTPPKTSATLEELASINKISLLEATEREKLIVLLTVFSDHAPKIHMSFAVEPSAGFLLHMISWLRANINPLVLMEVGLQPTLAAGCSVRTVNKVFDLSLRQRFVESRPLLVQSIAKFQNDPVPVGAEITAPSVESVQATTQAQTSQTSPATPQLTTQPATPPAQPVPTPQAPAPIAQQPINPVEQPVVNTAPKEVSK